MLPLLGVAAVPEEKMPLTGKLAPEFVMVLFEIAFPVLPVPAGVVAAVEIKTVPFVPLSHPFVERLVGTLRRECLDRTLFWTAVDLEAKLLAFRDYFNGYRSHAGLQGRLPEPGEAKVTVNFASYRWQPHCRGLFQTPRVVKNLKRIEKARFPVS